MHRELATQTSETEIQIPELKSGVGAYPEGKRVSLCKLIKQTVS